MNRFMSVDELKYSLFATVTTRVYAKNACLSIFEMGNHVQRHTLASANY